MWPLTPDGSRIAACFANKKHPSSEVKLRFCLLVASADGRSDRAIDLNEMVIAFVTEVDWK
jgi:hypothetical protein